MISSTMTVTASRRFPLVEAFLFSACVAWYIWQRQDYYQYSWIIFPVWLIASFAWNKDTLRSLGWRTDNLWSTAKRASVVFVPCALAILATGLLLEGEQHTFYHVLLPSRLALQHARRPRLLSFSRVLSQALQIQVSVLPRTCQQGVIWLSLCVVRPDTWNGESALRAPAIRDAILHYIVPRPPHKQLLAIRAIRVRAVAVNISLIHVAQADFHRDLPRTI